MTETVAGLPLDAIARTVTEVEPNLKDRFDAAVVLEILGYKDADARALGYSTLFDLADAVKDAARPYAWEEPLRDPPRVRESGLQLYLGGMFYNVGWMIMLVALFMGGQSLWAARDMPVAVSTAIGLGVVLGLVCTGGVQQFAAWKLIYYHLQGNQPLSRFVMRKSLVLGGLLVLAVAGAFAVLAVAVIGLPLAIAGLGAGYLVLIGMYRLAVTPVFAMKKFVAMIAMSLAALVAMFGTYHILVAAGLDRVGAVVASQAVGLAILLAVSLLTMWAIVFAEREEVRRPEDPPFYARRELPKKVNPPRFWVLALEGTPYLLYGTMYFIFLFADRLVSWFGSQAGPYALNYNSAYQIGADLALLVLVPITAIKYPIIYRFSEFLENRSKLSPSDRPEAFCRGVAAFHNGLTVRVAAASLTCVVVAYVLAPNLVGFAGGAADSVAVFRLSLIGVVLFSLFLSNAVFAMAFRRIGAMALLLVVAAVLNYVLAAAFVRTFRADAAVF
ncbi:MAG: hypothetical protein AABY30_04220, partial [Candidatus Thermoplasmatota archaeon]